MIKPEKQQEVEALKTKFGEAKGIVLADYTGVTVAEVSELRRKCREARVEYKVVKNTLARIAARDADIEDLVDHFDGPIAIALSSVDTGGPGQGAVGLRQDLPEDDPQGRLLRRPDLLAGPDRRDREPAVQRGAGGPGDRHHPVTDFAAYLVLGVRHEGRGQRDRPGREEGRRVLVTSQFQKVYGGER